VLNNKSINTESEINSFKEDLIKSGFYKNIREFLNTNYTEINFTQTSSERGTNRIKNIKKYVLNKSNILKSKTFKVESYLDIGCFDGGITKSIGSYFKLNNTQIHGVDIKKYNTYEFSFNEYNGYELPYADDSFDIITCLMVLHHIPTDKLEKLIDEIYRVLKNGGIVIIREHSPVYKLQEICLDIMHDFYDLVWNSDSNMKWISSNNNYKNSNGWIAEFLNASFIVDVNPYVYKNINTNPFMSYFCSFKKPH
jgi:ubiquinone/menaquinone biosynthesis C-methylase UbiE